MSRRCLNVSLVDKVRDNLDLTNQQTPTRESLGDQSQSRIFSRAKAKAPSSASCGRVAGLATRLAGLTAGVARRFAGRDTVVDGLRPCAVVRAEGFEVTLAEVLLTILVVDLVTLLAARVTLELRVGLGVDFLVVSA